MLVEDSDELDDTGRDGPTRSSKLFESHQPRARPPPIWPSAPSVVIALLLLLLAYRRLVLSRHGDPFDSLLVLVVGLVVGALAALEPRVLGRLTHSGWAVLSIDAIRERIQRGAPDWHLNTWRLLELLDDHHVTPGGGEVGSGASELVFGVRIRPTLEQLAHCRELAALGREPQPLLIDVTPMNAPWLWGEPVNLLGRDDVEVGARRHLPRSLPQLPLLHQVVLPVHGCELKRGTTRQFLCGHIGA